MPKGANKHDPNDENQTSVPVSPQHPIQQRDIDMLNGDLGFGAHQAFGGPSEDGASEDEESRNPFVDEDQTHTQYEDQDQPDEPNLNPRSVKGTYELSYLKGTQ